MSRPIRTAAAFPRLLWMAGFLLAMAACTGKPSESGLAAHPPSETPTPKPSLTYYYIPG